MWKFSSIVKGSSFGKIGKKSKKGRAGQEEQQESGGGIKGEEM